MKSIQLIWQGFLIGLGKIIPGVSGAMLAMMFGLYDRGLKAIDTLFKDFKENVTFLGTIGIGILLAIVFGSKMIVYCLSDYYLQTMLLFLGLIMGGIPFLVKDIKPFVKQKTNWLIFLIFFFITISLFFLKTSEQSIEFDTSFSSFLWMVLAGFIDAATMVIPGISGTALLMLIGCYQPLMQVFANLTDVSSILLHAQILFPFLIGLIVGIILTVKFIRFCFDHIPIPTKFAILALALASTILLFLQTLQNTYHFTTILCGCILFLVGYHISSKMEKQEQSLSK